jgi:Protein of unknown function (DUF2637)
MIWDRQTYAVAIPSAVVAVVAGVVSFGHIEGLALSVHQPLAYARLLPLAVDGLIVAGTVVILAGYWLGWLAVVLGVAATVFANLESGLPYGPLAAAVATWPAISFSVACFLLERWLKRQVSRGGQGGSGWLTDSDKERATLFTAESDLATPEPVASRGGQGGTEWLETGEFPQFAQSVTEPVLATPDLGNIVTEVEPPDQSRDTRLNQCGHTVAGTAEQNVVQAYLHERDCLAQTPSQRRLAATHGISRTKVAQLVGPLNGGSHDDA